MLETIKAYIDNLPNKTFGQFYQEYVIKMQDQIIESDISAFESQHALDGDANQLLSSVDTMVKELNTL